MLSLQSVPDLDLFFVTFSHHLILYENGDFPYGAKVKVACKAYLNYLSLLSSEIDFFNFEEHISASY